MAQVVKPEVLAEARERIRKTNALQAIAKVYHNSLNHRGLAPHKVPGGWMFGADELFVPVDDEIVATFAAWYSFK